MLKSSENSQALLLLNTWSISNRLTIYNLLPFLNKEDELLLVQRVKVLLLPFVTSARIIKTFRSYAKPEFLK